MSRKIVVLGGGVGGLVVANRLRVLKDVEVTLVDKKQEHLFYPSLLWLMIGKRKPDEIRRDLGVLERKGVCVLSGEVTGINPDDKSVTVGDEKLPYDYLIVALGADLVPERVPGLSEDAFNLYELESVKRLRYALEGFPGGKVVVLISSTPFKCPAAPYEAALLVEHFFHTRGKRGKIDLEVITPEPLPMPTAGPSAGTAMTVLLALRGIAFIGSTAVKEVDVSNSELIFNDGQKRLFDLLITVPPHQAPQVVAESPLAGSAGWIPVDPKTLATPYDGVYALGDVTTVPLPGRYKSDQPLNLPKAGVFAHHQADVVAHNIATEIKGRGGLRAFDGRGWCIIEAGYGRAAAASGNFYATPTPAVRFKGPGLVLHWEKVLFEKYWLRRWF